MNTRQIQETLAAAGFDPGPIDGLLGRRTLVAVRAFQASRGLTVDGIVGPRTAEALGHVAAITPGPADPVDPSLPWLVEAHRLLGTLEQPGRGSNEAIEGWSEPLDIDYRDDATPWCGLFVAHCMGSQLLDEVLPARPLLARDWRAFGIPCPTPQPGAVMVFWRGHPTGWRGHVGLYWAEDDEAYHILGGNQGDAVTVSRYPRARFLEARWPATAPAPSGGPRIADVRGRLVDPQV